MVGAAVVAGIAAGAITDAMIKHRTLADVIHSGSEEERNFVTEIGDVFGDTLPQFERIILTNLSHDSGRAFTWPIVDGSILMNLGEAFDSPMGEHPERGYPGKGQLLIHELTHAWQIENAGYEPAFICMSAIAGGGSYNYGPPYLKTGMAAPPFGSYGTEQQAAIVDQWFAGTRPEVTAPKAKDRDDPYFGYILNNIQFGETGK
jgi:hypothetical protein